MLSSNSDNSQELNCTHHQQCANNVDCLECSNSIDIKKKTTNNDDIMIKTLIDTSFTQLTNDIRLNFRNTFNNLKST